MPEVIENSKTVALRTIAIEIEALKSLRSSINNVFEKVIQLLFESKGRVVVSGIGKSALIAQKIVATLNSTGTASLYMHAGDAIHGDLGMIQDDDTLICLSKSGDTAEFKVVIPIVKSRNINVVGITANSKSYLGLNSDFVLLTPIQLEADPNNLAPTASSTAQLALGDAIAMALLYERGFTSSDFAHFHPGGNLGKQLFLRVKDLCQFNEKPQVSSSDELSAIILEMTSKRLGMTAVIDANHKLIGIITDGDLRRMMEQNSSMLNVKAVEIMTSNPKSIEENELAVKALHIMRTNTITTLITTKNGQYSGVVHLHDLVREGIL